MATNGDLWRVRDNVRESRYAQRIFVKVLVESSGGLEEAQSSRGAMAGSQGEKSHSFKLDCII